MTEPERVFSPGRLRAWAHVRGVPLGVLADAAGVSAGYVRACQYGHPSATPTPGTLAVWARLLGCDPGELCSNSPHDPSEYWTAANVALGPMRPEDIQGVADILDRSARRRATEHP